MTTELVTNAGMWSLPKDPIDNRQFGGIQTGTSCTNTDSLPWSYLYTTVTKNGISGGWFAVMAGTETLWWSNYAVENNAGTIGSGCIASNQESNTITLCETIIFGATYTDCTPVKNADQLRYLYLY
jgi:hypothetical protein